MTIEDSKPKSNILLKIVYGYSKVLKGIVRYINLVGVIIIFLVALVTIADVVGRYLGHPVKGAYDIVQMGLVTIVFFGAAYCILVKGHIVFSLVVDRFPKKFQLILDIVARVIEIIVWAILGCEGYKFALKSNAASSILAVDLTFNHMMIPFAAIFCILILINCIIEDIVRPPKEQLEHNRRVES